MKKIFEALFDVPFDTMGLSSKTLTFTTLREVSYLKERIERSYLRNRLLLLMAGVLFCLFYYFVGAELNAVMHAILPIIIAAVSYFGGFVVTSSKKYEHRLPLIYALSGACGVLSVLVFVFTSNMSFYYAGILFILSIITMMMLSIKLIWSIGAGVIGIILFIAHYAINYMPLKTVSDAHATISVISIIIFVLVCCAIVVGAYFHDYERRKNFYERKHGKENVAKTSDTVIKKVQNPVNKMFDSIMDVVFFITLEGDIKYISKSVKEFLGYESDELIGKRAIKLMSKASHKQFESQTARLYQDLNMVQSTFDYKTKGDLLKKGEVIIKAYSHNKFGDGFIGSIRPLTDKRAKELEQDVKYQHDLMQERDALKIDNQNLTLSVDDLKVKIDKLIQQSQTTKSMNSADFGDYMDGNSDFMAAYLSKDHQAHLQSLDQLKALFESKRMGKYDLKHYIQEAKALLDAKSSAIKLFDAYKSAMLFTLEHQQSYSQNNIKNSLEKSVVACADLFNDTDHVVDIKCSGELMASFDATAFEVLIKLLISRSMYAAFKNVQKGQITISVISDNGAVKLAYSDNGKYVSGMPFESVFIDSYFADVCDTFPDVNCIQDILGVNYLKATKFERGQSDNLYQIFFDENK